MTLEGQNTERPDTDVRIDRITAPPSRVQLAALMSEAEESAPHSQEIRFSLPDGSIYLLTVTYLSRIEGEPTWVLSTEDQDPPVVFWSIETENPEQIYNLIIKRARNPFPKPTNTNPDLEAIPESKKPTHEGLPRLPQPQPSGYSFNDRYEVIEEVGCGGMSRVYRARDRKTDKEVAVKVLHPHLMREGSAKNPKKRFEQEFKATMALAHPNIVAVKDHGFTADGLPFMVMEYIDGNSLEQLLRAHNRLRLSQFLTVFYQTCRALSHAHVRGVIHRDVKPSNIMMVKTEQNVNIVKLLDFGIAKIHRETDEESLQKLTQTGDVFGSPYYMSPEQCRGESLDARSDIYSLGCVMYQAITGKRPFEGENAYKTIYMHVNIRPLRFGDIRPDLSIPPKLEKIILKCLEKEPRNRYQTSEELSLEIERLAQEVSSEDEESWITRQTGSGTFYAVHPSTGKEEPANVASVLKLLLKAGIISNDEYAKASNQENPQAVEVGTSLVKEGLIDNKTLHAAVQCQALIEKGNLKIEKAIIALHYCQRSRIGLDEALDELGWKTGTGK
ncbi:MAG: serine/threonine protein kinase [Candidatus Melainabacteria bacterium]|nr:serine/threonine protein kinase [Candidatus Melainabacteria bacterium]